MIHQSQDRYSLAAQEDRKDQGRERRDEGDNGKKVVHQLPPPIDIQVTSAAMPSTIQKA